MNIPSEQAKHELDAIREASRAVGQASATIGRRLITCSCPPGSPEKAQVSAWQAKLAEASRLVREVEVQARGNMPAVPARASPSFTGTGQLGADWTGD